MALRDTLKFFIPKYLWELVNHPQGYVITPEEYNERWNLIREAADHTATTVDQVIDMLYETVLSDDASVHIKLAVPGITGGTLSSALVELKDAIGNSGDEEDLSQDLSIYALNVDAFGIATEIRYKRADGTLAIKSQLANGTAPQYTLRSVFYYAPDGVTVVKTVTYALSYDGPRFLNEVIV